MLFRSASAAGRAADQFHVPQGRLNPRGGEPALAGEFDRKTRISGFRPHSQNGVVPRSPGSAMNKSAHTTPKTSTERDPRWAAVLARYPSANARFAYAERTTGVSFRPGSPSDRKSTRLNSSHQCATRK